MKRVMPCFVQPCLGPKSDEFNPRQNSNGLGMGLGAHQRADPAGKFQKSWDTSNELGTPLFTKWSDWSGCQESGQPDVESTRKKRTRECVQGKRILKDSKLCQEICQERGQLDCDVGLQDFLDCKDSTKIVKGSGISKVFKWFGTYG